MNRQKMSWTNSLYLNMISVCTKLWFIVIHIEFKIGQNQNATLHIQLQILKVNSTVAVDTSEFNDSKLLPDTGGFTFMKFLQETFQGHLCLRITDAYVLG